MRGGGKRAVLIWHRRAGKEVTCFNWMVLAAVQRVGYYAYYFPNTRLGRRILWDGITKDGSAFMNFIPKELVSDMNSVEMKITLVNGSIIQIIGTDQIINVGINPVGCVFSEFSLMDPKAWEFTRPILRENEGWAVFNFTPRGRNHAYELYLTAKQNDNWFVDTRSVLDTEVLSAEDIESERRDGMSEELIQQEFFCSFDIGIEGSVYGKYLNKMIAENRVCNIPFDYATRVCTYWDLGLSDDTTILFVQHVGHEIRIFDSYSNKGEGLHHYAKVLQDKKEEYNLVYDRHYAPHDIRQRELSSARTRWHIARDLGITFDIIPNLPIHEGIELARIMFSKLYIHEKKCEYLIKCIENYHFQYNDRLDIFSDKPVHDWSSHYCDALRYLGVSSQGGARRRLSREDAESMQNAWSPRRN